MINERPEAFAHARHAICCAVVLVIGTPQTASALDVDPPPAKSTRAQPAAANEPNTATLRPIAIRLEGTLSLLSLYSVGMTAGYAFHPMFALEGTAAWEGGFTHGIMGRLRLPVSSWSSISVGIGATVLWVPWKGEHNWPGIYVWLPGEIGWEYRTKDGYHFLIGVGARLFTHTKQDVPDFPLCILCLSDPPRVFPAGRIGVGWAF